MRQPAGLLPDLGPLLEHLEEGVLLHAVDGVVLACNHRAADLLGVSGRDLLGRTHPLSGDLPSAAMPTIRILPNPARAPGRPVRLRVRSVPWRVETAAGSIATATFLSDVEAPQAPRPASGAPTGDAGTHALVNVLTVIVGQADLLLIELPALDPRRARALDIRAAAERGAELLRWRAPNGPERSGASGGGT